MHFIKRMEFTESNVPLHAFKQISDLKIIPECFHGPLKSCGGAHAFRGPVFAPPALNI